MTQERTTWTARTATGTLIRSFADRKLAMAWADTCGRDYPGHLIAVETEVRIIRSRVIRRDRSRAEAVA